MSTFKSANGLCEGTISIDNQHVVVKGYCQIPAQSMKYMAAAPPDFRMSRDGSGLPWANPNMAYDNTPNKGEIPIVNGSFTFTLVRPNCYYMDNGAKLIAPHVHFTIGNQHFDVELGIPCIPNRSLKSLPGKFNRSVRR